MSSFWSGWIMLLVVFNLGVTLFLFLWGQKVHIPVLNDGTTGHVWAHGVIREGVRNLPMWWVLFSGLMFVLGIGYLVLYPGFGSFKGVLGWTSQGQLQEDVARNQAKLAPVMQRIHEQPVERLSFDSEVTDIGHRLFQDNCAACHGRQAHGNPLLGAPTLASGAWLYGGDGDTLMTSILDGRQGVMPPFGEAFGAEGVSNLSNYVLSLSGAPHDEAKAALGEPSFAVCSACHGAEGKGNPLLGSPDLTDHVWVYGGDLATLEKTIHDGRSGVMPAWRERLGEDQSRAIAAWVFANAKGEAVGGK